MRREEAVNGWALPPIERRPGDWAATWTGKRFYLLDPRVEDMCIEDGAHHLARLCRYGGAIKGEWYSVAEHSWLLAMYVLNLSVWDKLFDGTDNRFEMRRLYAYWMLMHDIGETWYGDVRRPIKNSNPTITVEMEKTDRVAATKWNIPHPHPAWMKDLDERIVMDEKLALITPAEDGTPWVQEVRGLKPLGVDIRGWNPTIAETAFLSLFNQLNPENML